MKTSRRVPHFDESIVAATAISYSVTRPDGYLATTAKNFESRASYMLPL